MISAIGKGLPNTNCRLHLQVTSRISSRVDDSVVSLHALRVRTQLRLTEVERSRDAIAAIDFGQPAQVRRREGHKGRSPDLLPHGVRDGDGGAVADLRTG